MIKNTFGFTMIELLIVISVIGILAGVMVAVIDPTHSQDVAEDGVRISTLDKVAQGLETYHASEGGYPNDVDSDFDPSDDPVISHYMNIWPDTGITGSDVALVNYIYTRSAALDIVCISVPMATSPSEFFMYTNPYNAGIHENVDSCISRILKGCASNCDDSVYVTEDCEMLDDTSCSP